MSMEIGSNTVTVDIGSEIKFTTLNSYQNVQLTGTVEGFCIASVAKSISDVVNYNEQVLKTSDVSDVDDMEFVLIRSDDGSLTAYATEWFDVVENITVTGNVTLLLKNVTSEDVLNAMTLLTTNGYVVRQQ